ncbi:MAG: hypothetical protein GY851_18520 [bacterium]|nr:hypothetical protein [bacterium]
MTREFEERKSTAWSEDPVDNKALQFVKSWHRHPAVHEAVWYKGVNLGEMAEYALIPEMMTVLVDREKGAES